MWQIDVLVEGVCWTTLSCLAIMIMRTAAWRSRHGLLSTDSCLLSMRSERPGGVDCQDTSRGDSARAWLRYVLFACNGPLTCQASPLKLMV
jgi:hypothetical protein